jgi:predicted Ser/Thr protein kinase
MAGLHLKSGDYLSTLSARVRKSFEDDRTILSYPEWFDVLLEHPSRNLRASSQYAKDCFDYFGIETRELPQGKVERFKLFDAPWAEGDRRVAGQEQVQHDIYRLISNFVRDGRVSRLILLHGPNGSAKSTIVHCIQSAMEYYSRQPEGALYTYAWIFPSEKIAKGALGFGDTRDKKIKVEGGAGESYAHLRAEQIDARLPCELRDHPIFFVPKAERAALIDTLKQNGSLPKDFVVSRYVLEGDLSPRDRAIYDALLVAYDGNHEEVLRHVQVQRFYVSIKYGLAVSTVEPQISVDAHARQVTGDRSLNNLPRSVQNLPLYELEGPLVSANRGLLEYADILKRPLDALKYLLTTSEEATASLPEFKITLDEVLIASTNETYLEAFKKNPDWNSFKGRIELVPVPYLRRFEDEVEIYRPQIRQSTIVKPLAPHVVEVAALWAVLTRLKKPDKNRFSGAVRSVIARLTPLDKLRLYDTADVPAWCTATEAKELRRAIAGLLDETRGATDFEGHRGASAREIRTLILNASHHPRYRSLTPLPVFDELLELIRDRTLYDFLQQQVQDGFHDHEGFIKVVREWWMDILDDEVRSSMGLVEETRYEELFARYVLHVSHFLKREKLLDKITGRLAEPDEGFMREVESSILAEKEDRLEFRKAIIGQIGAWGLENTGKTPDYRKIFTHYIEKLEEDFYRERRKVIAKNIVSALKLLGDGVSELSEEDREVADRTVKTMANRFHYPSACAAECMAYLLKERYSTETA